MQKKKKKKEQSQTSFCLLHRAVLLPGESVFLNHILILFLKSNAVQLSLTSCMKFNEGRQHIIPDSISTLRSDT